jgi:hypothetical protein
MWVANEDWVSWSWVWSELRAWRGRLMMALMLSMMVGVRVVQADPGFEVVIG